MKRLAILILQLALVFAAPLAMNAQGTTDPGQFEKAIKKQQKMTSKEAKKEQRKGRKAAKKQDKAMRKYEKAERKALEKTNPPAE